jgi:hypothetical protein
MSEFFGRLEAELRAAAERPPRREVPVPALAVASLLAVAVAPIVLVLGSGDEEQRAGQETPDTTRPADPEVPGFPGAQVVATGTAPGAGRWELLSYRSERIADPETGEVAQPAGLRCIGVRLLDPPDRSSGPSGQCGEFPRTPGFSRVQRTIVDAQGGAREILVYGRAPEDAALVRVTLETGAPIEVKPIEGPAGSGGDFYLISVPPGDEGVVNWIDGQGNEGSSGHELLPP